jgi:MerR family transcriptional regulator, light-induced transcriptional regulator
MSRNQPIYNIGVVARVTDIPAATLRVWERRYGFPDTSRTEGGHRLYSEEDIQRLRWVKSRVDEGMQTRQAVRALKSLEESGGALLDTGTLMSELDSTDGPATEAQEIEAGSYIELLKHRLFETLIRHDTLRADDLFSEALALYSPEDVMLHMIRPTLREIGEGWARGDIKIGTEHLATGYLRQRLLAWLRSGPPLFSVPPTVLACAPGEYHEGSLMIFGALMRRRRWPVAYLGQSIPLPDLASFVETANPLAIVIVAMTEEPAAALARWPEYFPDIAQSGRPVFGYGGMIFNQVPEWRAKVRGLFLGATLTEGVESLERILRRTALLVE